LWLTARLRPAAPAGSAAILAKMRAQRAESAAKAAASAARKVTVAYASQTGTCQEIAKMVAADAEARGIKSSVCALNDLPFDTFSAETHPVVVLVSASTGDGDPPDSAARFWVALRKRDVPKDKLRGMLFCSMGLGDSNYTRFMAVPRGLAKRFADLGASPFYRNGEADEVDGIDDTVDDWIDGLWGPLERAVAGAAAAVGGGGDAAKGAPPAAAAPADPAAGAGDVAWVCPAGVEPQGVPAAPHVAVRVADAAAPPAPSPSAAELAHASPSGEYSAEAPFWAPVKASRVLTSAASESAAREGREDWRRVVSVTFDLSGSGLCVQPGDSVAVRARNDPALVDALLQRLGLDGERAVVVAGADGDHGRPAHLPAGAVTVRELFLRDLDVTHAPRKTMLAGLAGACGDAAERRTLAFLASRGGKEHYRAQVLEARPTLLDLLERFPSCRPSLELVLTLAPPLAPRLYSVTNCGEAAPGEAEVALSVVRFGTPYREGRRGVASNWLDAARGDAGARVPLYVRPGGHFGAPEDLSVPWVMIGPGTGVAPFRGFLQRRRLRAQRGERAGGQAWLYFGCRRREEDYLYGDELEGFAADGTLSRLRVAFSRERPGAKEYVQDLMRADGAELAALVRAEGARVFVCGDGAGMAKDVHACLEEVLRVHGGLGAAEATGLLAAMTREGRYVRDIWCA